MDEATFQMAVGTAEYSLYERAVLVKILIFVIQSQGSPSKQHCLVSLGSLLCSAFLSFPSLLLLHPFLWLPCRTDSLCPLHMQALKATAGTHRDKGCHLLMAVRQDLHFLVHFQLHPGWL